MATFQSEFEDNDKLKQCAAKDSDHIGESFAPQGPWVLLIKKALNAWAATQSPAVTPLALTDLFDRQTGDLVAQYKRSQTPPILNYAGQIDRIVGKKTVVALDKELPARNPAPTPTPALTMSALAQQDKATSIQWAIAAMFGLQATSSFLNNPIARLGPIPAQVGVTLTALETHFHISTATIDRGDFIDQVFLTYNKTLAILNASSSFFIDDTTSAEAAAGTPAHVPFGSGKVNFTPAFRERSGTTGFGPMCRAAMVLHEPVHIVDHPAASQQPNHVHENSPQYATTPAMNQIHNAHSYACFAQQVFFNGTDARFGIGRAAE